MSTQKTNPLFWNMYPNLKSIVWREYGKDHLCLSDKALNRFVAGCLNHTLDAGDPSLQLFSSWYQIRCMSPKLGIISNIILPTEADGPFDEIEVIPIWEVEKGVYEQCSWHQAQLYSVFVRSTHSGIISISDCHTISIAERLEQQLRRRLLPKPDTQFTATQLAHSMLAAYKALS